MIVGADSAKAMMPNQAGEWVSSQVETTQGHLLMILTDTVTNVLAGGGPTAAVPGTPGTAHGQRPAAAVG